VTVSFRSKLFYSYAVLAILMAGLFYGYSNHFLSKRLVEENRALLLSEAGIVRLQIEGLPAGASLQALIERLGGAMNARITLVALSGRVLADSDVHAGQVAAMENHLERPEIKQALATGMNASAERYSETLRTLMLYVAVPYHGAVGEGVVRLAMPLSSLAEARRALQLGLGVVAGGVLLLALLFSAILSGIISRPLRAMADAAARFGAGDWTLRVPIVGEDEGAYLGRVLNQMADRIEQQMLRLKDERQQLDTILQSMGEGVVVLDPLGRIILANTAFQHHFGLQAEVVGNRLVEVCRNPDLLNLYQMQRESGREISAELTLPANRITFATHWVPLGKQEGTVAVFHDISELKRLELVRRDFVANVSHELRTPVTVIKGYAETLLDGVLTTDAATASRFVTTIHGHADRLAALIGDLLALSELEAAGYQLEMTTLALADSSRKVCSLLEGKAFTKGITIANELTTSLPPVLANQQRLEQVFFNLLDNAITYTPAGGMVTIAATPGVDTIRVRISDTGPGIPPEHLPRLFERFYRVDSSRSRDQGGTGLGLAIVKHIVHLHGGTVSVESTPGAGTTFSFTFPLRS
jgi:two-component system, OmpR family, phosphate regulon sensor histidine kinase PhoR